MRIQKLFCSVAMVGLMGVTYAQLNAAQAQSRTMHLPESKWSLSKVADKNQQGRDYCAAAQKFNRDIILTFARNIEGESSLAVDFQKPKLPKGEILSVSLDPGAGAQRDYEVTTPSGKAFVVRLGQDEEFFEAMKKTGFLNVRINGDSYNFDLADVDDGKLKLESCVASLVMPAAGDEEPQADVAQAEIQPEAQTTSTPEAPGSYRHEINMLRQQMKELKAENDRLAAKADTAGPVVVGPVQAEPLDATAPSADLLAELEKLRAENESLRAKPSEDEVVKKELEQLRADNQRMSSELEAVHADALKTVRPQPSDQQRAENEALKAKNAELEQKLAAAVQNFETDNQIKEKYGAELDQLKIENQDLKAKIAQANPIGPSQPDSKLAELNSKIAQLEADKQKLTDELLSAKSTPAPVALGPQAPDKNLLTTIETLSQENAALKSTIEQQTAQQATKVDSSELLALQARLEESENKNKNLQEELELAQKNAAAAQSEAQINEGKFASLQAALAEKEVAIQNMTQQNLDFAELQKRNHELEQKLAAFQAVPVPAVESIVVAEPIVEVKDTAQDEAQAASAAQMAALEKQALDKEARIKDLEAALERAEQEQSEKDKQIASLKTQTRPEPLKVAAVEAQRLPKPQPKPVQEVIDGAPYPNVEQQVQAEELQKQAPQQDKVEENSNLQQEVVVDEPSPEPVIENQTDQPQDIALTEAQKQEMAMAEGLRQADRSRPAEEVAQQESLEPVAAQAPYKVSKQTEPKTQHTTLSSVAKSQEALELKNILQGANVVASSNDVQLIKQASGSDKKVYQWRSADGGTTPIFGSAEQKAINNISEFDESVQNYLEKTQSRCAGDFAIVPDKSLERGNKRIDSYEVACVGQNVSSAASIVFYSQDGVFTAMAHEAPAENMDMAMNIRDRLLQAISGS